MPPHRAEALLAIPAPKKHSNRSTVDLPENTPKNVNEINGAKTPFRAQSLHCSRWRGILAMLIPRD